MKGHKKKQQKDLARRTERRAAHKGPQPKATAQAPSRGIRAALTSPLLGCWAQKGWQDAGLAAVVVARRQPDGLVTFGTYVVDYWCLGVKDAFARAGMPQGRFMREILLGLTQGAPVELTPAVAHELVYGGIEYAARWGFRPHSDFQVAQWVLDPPGQYLPTGQVTFGREGKPLYVSGPHDHPEAIVRQLARTAGEGNFDYIAFAGPPKMFESDAESETTVDFDVVPFLDAGAQPPESTSLLDGIKRLARLRR